jgi:hypothetical protein
MRELVDPLPRRDDTVLTTVRRRTMLITLSVTVVVSLSSLKSDM